MVKNSFFNTRGKTILLIVPHPDDEINVMGSLCDFFSHSNKLIVIFVTSGDKNNKMDIREKEAINFSNSLGGDICIVFLRFPDTFIYENKHLYNLESTYSNEVLREQTNKYIGLTPKQCLIQEIVDSIRSFHPDYVFFNGYDSHPDHKMVFLCTLKAIDEMVDSDGYLPEFFYSFAYETSYNAPNDYLKINFSPTILTKKLTEQKFVFWNSRVRFPVVDGYLNYYHKKSKLFPLLRQYKSQKMHKRFFGIQNTDHVFWKLPSALLQASLQKRKKISKYLLFDTDNVLSPNSEYLVKANEPSDRSFDFSFSKIVEIKSIIIIGENLVLAKENIKVMFERGSQKAFADFVLENRDKDLYIIHLNLTTFWVGLRIDNNCASLERILFDNDTSIRMCKICYDGNFIYNFLCKRKKEYLFSLYSNFDSDLNNYDFYLDGVSVCLLNGVFFSKYGTHSLMAVYKYNKEIFDEVDLVVNNSLPISFLLFRQRIGFVFLTFLNSFKRFIVNILVKVKHAFR